MGEHRHAEGRGLSAYPPTEGRGPRAMLDGSHDYVVRIDADDRMVYVNRCPPWAKVEDLVGRSILELVDPSDRVARKACWDEVRRSGIPATLHVVRTGSRGEPIELDLHCVPFPGDASHDLLLLYSDVTARVRARRSSELVPERDVSVTEAAVTPDDQLHDERDRLKAQLGMAERMASLGTLAAGVAHEINNPLAYIQTNLEFATEELARISDLAVDEVRQAIQDAEHGVKRVRSIVSDLRMFARVDDDDHQENIDVPAAIEAAVNLVSSQIRQAANLVCRFGPVPRIMADPSRLSQVFVNLLVNAVQALGPNTEQNEITVSANANDEGSAVIEFRDNGCGISSANLARIFHAFFTTKPVGVGTGLGLAISHNLVTKMGGRFEVESEVGLGTTFRLIFPACATAAAPIAPTERRERVAHSHSVLVIDDEPLIGVSIRRVLPEHTVTLAVSPLAALDRIERGELYDVIICDVIMPSMGARQFIPALAKASPTLAERVILTSGGMLSPEVRNFVESAPYFLPKPFDAEQLRRLIDDVCATQSSRADEIAAIKTHDAEARVFRRGARFHVEMTGLFDSQRLADALHVFTTAIHAKAMGADVEEVVVDLRRLQLLTSSCFKSFVTWVGRLEDADVGEQYRILVLTDGARNWQRRSFDALNCFAPELVRVETT